MTHLTDIVERVAREIEIHSIDVRSTIEALTPSDLTYLLSEKAPGWKVVPVDPTEEMIEAGRREMPVEVDYWQENRMLHAKMRPISECVSPAEPYRAMLAACPGR